MHLADPVSVRHGTGKGKVHTTELLTKLGSVIPIQQINDAYKAVEQGEVRFRYVIDMASLKQEDAGA